MSYSTVAEIIAGELAAAREMRECLLQEQAHLISADVGALASNQLQKDALFQRLNQIGIERTQAFSATPYEKTDAGMRQWLASLSPAAQNDWRDLISVAADSKELNRTNGLLINQHLVRVQKALQSLRGSKPAGVYGRNGQHDALPPSRTIVAT